ncbi:N-6 DNA methylase [Microcoleus sp. Pol11C2]|uniref:N-6 DNA methylase n=1 Tax=Microcoleus sp. Pol11C2 TaxID=3055389 RepID=UPI002FD54966
MAFEEFMGGFFKGDFGQYFTPRELIAFAVEVLNPQRKQLVLDPACGSGGFLLYALDHVRREANRRFPKYKTDAREGVEHFKYWHDFAQHNLFGIEINEELARVAKMNMIIHDDGHTNIIGHDALDFLNNLTKLKSELVPDKFDLILTNPPFGSVVKSTEKEKGYLDQFELRRYLNKSTTGTEPDESAQSESNAKRGAKAVKERTSIKTEILFIERVHSYLKPGTGQAGIVLPDGILTNSSLQGVRNWMLSHFQILAVVSLPQFAFTHYDAGVKTSIVFLRRLKDGETVPDDAPIFMALAENIGYDATGRETFNVTVEKEIAGKEKIERHGCDLFEYRVYFEWSTVNPKEQGWSERHREIIPDTGLVAQWREFQRDPNPFFV